MRTRPSHAPYASDAMAAARFHEARGLRHHLFGPGRLRHDVDLDALDARDTLGDRRLYECLNVLAQRTGWSRHRHRDVDAAALDRDAVHKTKVDDVDPQLGIDHIPKRAPHVSFSHASTIGSQARSPAEQHIVLETWRCRSRSNCKVRHRRRVRRAAIVPRVSSRQVCGC